MRLVERTLAAHYPPRPVLGKETVGALDALIAETSAHPERFQVDRYRYSAPEG